MIDIFQPGVDRSRFLRSSLMRGYGMQEGLVDPGICTQISEELRRTGYLVDLTEQVDVEHLTTRNMPYTALLRSELNRVVESTEGYEGSFLSHFSVRVFTPDTYATTIHRNHSTVGNWIIGTTLRGNAPFHVYDQGVIGKRETRDLLGDGTDPTPIAIAIPKQNAI
jgi:hypothetical protein